MQLGDLQEGDCAEILDFVEGSDVDYRQKLLSFGLLPGKKITLVRKAPLGDPLQISVDDSSLVLRKKEAEILLVKKVSA